MRNFVGCLWRNGVTNFHGEAFVWQDGEWVLVQTTNKALQKEIKQTKFKMIIDNSDEFLSSHLSEGPYRFLDLTAELSGLMAEQGAGNLTTFFDKGPRVETKLSRFQTVLDYLKLGY